MPEARAYSWVRLHVKSRTGFDSSSSFGCVPTAGVNTASATTVGSHSLDGADVRRVSINEDDIRAAVTEAPGFVVVVSNGVVKDKKWMERLRAGRVRAHTFSMALGGRGGGMCVVCVFHFLTFAMQFPEA